MGKIIIENKSDLSMLDAIHYVEEVIKKGRISNNNTQYSYATLFVNGIVISATRNKNSDKFVVYFDESVKE